MGKPSGQTDFLNNTLSPEKLASMKAGRIPSRGTFTLQGVVQPGKRLTFRINGDEFLITDITWIVGTLTPGCAAKVQGTIYAGIGPCATRITVLR